MMRVLFAFVALLMTVTVSAQGLNGPNFYIVSATADSSAYNFLIDGAVVTDPALNLTVGTTYQFILNGSMQFHPFGFSNSGDENANPVPLVSLSVLEANAMLSGACTPSSANTSWYTTSGSETTNPCIISLTPPNDASGLLFYYRCAIHSRMVGSLPIVGGTTSNPTSTSAPTTTSAPTNSAPTNSTPATPIPTTPPQGGDAACIVPGAIAVIAVAINALFSA